MLRDAHLKWGMLREVPACTCPFLHISFPAKSCCDLPSSRALLCKSPSSPLSIFLWSPVYWLCWLALHSPRGEPSGSVTSPLVPLDSPTEEPSGQWHHHWLPLGSSGNWFHLIKHCILKPSLGKTRFVFHFNTRVIRFPCDVFRFDDLTSPPPSLPPSFSTLSNLSFSSLCSILA